MKLRDSNGDTNHIVPLSNGVLRQPHIERIGPAFPLFAKLEDLVTTGEGSDGLVLAGKPVADQDLADMLGHHRKTIAVWRRRLQEHGYITSKRTPVGNVIRVRKSKKWFWIRSKTDAKVGVESLPGGSENTPRVGVKKGGSGSDFLPGGSEKGIPNKTYQYRSRDVGAAPTEECWKAIGENLPLGTVRFQAIWSFLFAHKNGEPLSQAMERAIQRALAAGVSVPKPFYTAKRRVEERETRQPEAEPIRTLTPEEIPA